MEHRATGGMFIRSFNRSWTFSHAEPVHTQVSVKYQDQEHKMNLKCTGAVATCAENNRPCTELKINSLQYVQHDLTCSHSETIDPMKFKSIHTHSETHSETRDPMKFKSIHTHSETHVHTWRQLKKQNNSMVSLTHVHSKLWTNHWTGWWRTAKKVRYLKHQTTWMNQAISWHGIIAEWGTSHKIEITD